MKSGVGPPGRLDAGGTNQEILVSRVGRRRQIAGDWERVNWPPKVIEIDWLPTKFWPLAVVDSSMNCSVPLLFVYNWLMFQRWNCGPCCWSNGQRADDNRGPQTKAPAEVERKSA